VTQRLACLDTVTDLVHRQPRLAEPVKGPRRISVVKWGDALSLRVKRIEAAWISPPRALA
jgi:hypothetical protein